MQKKAHPHTSQTAHPRQHLAQERYRHGWSQQEVATRLGTTPLNVSRWERGLTTPTAYFRHKLCTLYDATAVELELVSDPTHESKEAIQEEEHVAAKALLDPAIPLPSAVRLVGRDEEMRTIKQSLLDHKTVALSALNGLPGVGKTALATELAYDEEVRAAFPDGLLWAALGTTPNMLSILSRWGTLLGISSDERNKLTSIEAWTATIRVIIGQRRFLLVIDDAWQLEPALACQIGGPHCSYLLTTRFPQIALTFASTRTYTVRELDDSDGLRLLRTLAPEVVEREPEQVHTLLQAIGGLPLALTLVGNALRVQSHDKQPRRIRAALARLQHAQARLNLTEMRHPLDHTSNSTQGLVSLQAVIETSVQWLNEAQRTTLRALSIFPPKPTSFSEEAACAASQGRLETLDALTDAGLLESVGPERYVMHQTIADYASLQGVPPETPSLFVAYFVHYAQVHEQHLLDLEREDANILAALETAFEQQYLSEYVNGVLAFSPFLRTRGLLMLAQFHLTRAQEAARTLEEPDKLMKVLILLAAVIMTLGELALAESFLQESLQLARSLGDIEMECEILKQQVVLFGRRGRYDDEERCLQQALPIARSHHFHDTLCSLLSSEGLLLEQRGNYTEATSRLQEGLTLARQLDNVERVVGLLINLGVVKAKQGDYAQAKALWEEGLTLTQTHKLPVPQCTFLSNLGRMAAIEGDQAKAEMYLQKGLMLARQIGDVYHIALLLRVLAELRIMQEHLTQAEVYLQEALVFIRMLGSPPFLGDTYNGLGQIALQMHQLHKAEALFREYLTLVTPTLPEHQGRAYYGLARVAEAQGNTQEALRLGETSLHILEGIGHELAEPVKAWLDTLGTIS